MKRLLNVLTLDVGCGTNKSYKFRPSEVSINTVFMDVEYPSSDVIAIGNWIVGDAELMPFRPNSFTKIYASHLIEHLNNPEKFIYSCKILLKSRGMLTIKTPNLFSKNINIDSTHKHVFTVFRLIKIARKLNMRVVYHVNIGRRVNKLFRFVLGSLVLVFCNEICISFVK